MKRLSFVVMAVMLIGVVSPVFGQDVTEVEKPAPSSVYLDVKQKVDIIRNQDRAQAIAALTEALPGIKDPYERFDIIFWELSFLYAESGQYEKCYDILKTGQNEGLFYPLQAGERKFPEYVDSLAGMSGFDAFLARNDQLKQEAQKSARFEYIVQLPAGYQKDKKYPLLVALFGGFGSHIKSTEVWRSPKLESEFVVLSLQGSEFRGSFLHSFTKDDMARIVEAYRRVTETYGIDSSRVIIAGPSAGGARAIVLAQDRLIPVAGLILAFPMRPQSLDEQKLDTIAKSGIRAAFLCGELDRGIKQQKEMGVIFDKHSIPNRFIIASGIGHEFPPDFSKQLDLSLAFIFSKE